MPHTQWAEEVGVVRDEAGYLVTGPDLMKNGYRPKNWPLDRDPYYMETNMPGVFAAGDVRHNSVKRCASAVGEGAMVVTFVHRYVTSGEPPCVVPRDEIQQWLSLVSVRECVQ